MPFRSMGSVYAGTTAADPAISPGMVPVQARKYLSTFISAGGGSGGEHLRCRQPRDCAREPPRAHRTAVASGFIASEPTAILQTSTQLQHHKHCSHKHGPLPRRRRRGRPGNKSPRRRRRRASPGLGRRPGRSSKKTTNQRPVSAAVSRQGGLGWF